jgi:hypothetical protein
MPRIACGVPADNGCSAKDKKNSIANRRGQKTGWENSLDLSANGYQITPMKTRPMCFLKSSIPKRKSGQMMC